MSVPDNMEEIILRASMALGAGVSEEEVVVTETLTPFSTGVPGPRSSASY